MSVRFVIGRAGAGKTHHCLESIRSALRASPVDGPRLVLLVPEQASLQMERALLSGDVRATARAEVLSFRRLALRVLQHSGAMERTALSAVARAMVLRTIIVRLGPRLRYYKRVERLTGFLDGLGRTVSELIEEAIGPADLRAALDGVADPQRTAKLADLADIYAAYLEYLGDSRLDASQYLALAREALPRCDFLAGACLWVDGFAGFTRQELLLLVDLARRAAMVDISLLIDPEYHAQAASVDDVDETDLFAKPQRTYLTLRDHLRAAGLEVTGPLVLQNAVPPRFAACPELAGMEARLAADAGEGGAPSATPPKRVALIEAPDRRTEVDFAVAQVCRWVQETAGRLRYRDVAVIVRDLEPYHDLLTAALAERNVPYFIDRRRSVAHHPLVELVRGAIACAATSFGLEAVRLLLKTDLLGLSAEAADELENYVLAHGIAGAGLWTEADWTYLRALPHAKGPTARQRSHLARVNAARRRVREVLVPFADLACEPRPGGAWAEALGALLDRAGAAGQLEAWAQSAADDGDVAAAAEHRQTWLAVVALLDDLAGALADVRLDIAELAAVAEAGLAELSLGLIPPTVDQVLVGSIERSRHPDIKAAIVLGFNEGVFPLAPAEGSILNDDDRVFLAGGKHPVGVTRRQRILDEALLAYVAATRPSERLLVTYAATDGDGRSLRPSPYLAWLGGAAGGLKPRPLGDPFAARASWPVMTGRDLALSLAMEMRHRPPRSEDDAAKRRAWNDLYALARLVPEHRGALQRSLAALAYRNEAKLSPASVAALTGGTYTASVSELETLAACPFQRFARYALRLEERREADLQAVDVGTIHHAVLEDFLNGCLAGGESFADVAEGDVLARLEQSLARVGAHLRGQGELSSARDAYVLARSARDLSPIVRHQQRISGGGRFRPRAAERKFGFSQDPESLPPLEIDTPLGRKVRLRGLIDRVDLAELGDEILGVVVDYKRIRDKRLDISSVYHGLSLQLVAYLLALAERGTTLAGRPITPVGAFYVSLLRKYRPVPHPDDAGETDVEAEEAFPRGIFDAGRYDLLEAGAPLSGWGRLFRIFRKKDGTLGHVDHGDAAEPRQFAAVLAHTRRRLGELADAVLDGDISVTPYRLGDFSPCQWCPVQAVCRFEFGDPGMRRLEELSRGAALERMEGGE